MVRFEDYVKSVLAGCGMEPEMMELTSILHQVSEEYHSGKVTDDELTQLCMKICESVVVLASRCGRALTHDRCVEDLAKSVKESPPRGTLRSLISTLRARRRAGGTAPTGGIVP